MSCLTDNAMSYIALFIKKVVNLGVFSRGLLVIVKPLCLWVSLEIDTDNGIGLAQVFLLGMMFVSFSGSNAHKKFYEVKFSKSAVTNYSLAKHHFSYLHIITHQLTLILLLAIPLVIFLFDGSLAVVCAGIMFGLGEKINDEYQRHAQFINNSHHLFSLALVKIVAGGLAVSLSYFEVLDTPLSFAGFILLGALFINSTSLLLCTKTLLRGIRRSFRKTIGKSIFYIKNDAAQIAWVFTGMLLMSLDKWLIQYLSSAQLPKYMLLAQIASIAIVVQTIFLVAPVRVRLINENPVTIRALKLGSPLIAFSTLLVGSIIYGWFNLHGGEEGVGHFAFFIAAIVVFSIPYSERLYWVVSSNLRILIDAIFIGLYIITVLFYVNFFEQVYWLTGCLVFLVIMLFTRLLLMVYLLRVKGNK